MKIPRTKEFSLDANISERRKVLQKLKAAGVSIWHATTEEFDSEFPYLQWDGPDGDICSRKTPLKKHFRPDEFLAKFGLPGLDPDPTPEENLDDTVTITRREYNRLLSIEKLTQS